MYKGSRRYLVPIKQPLAYSVLPPVRLLVLLDPLASREFVPTLINKSLSGNACLRSLAALRQQLQFNCRQRDRVNSERGCNKVTALLFGYPNVVYFGLLHCEHLDLVCVYKYFATFIYCNGDYFNENKYTCKYCP